MPGVRVISPLDKQNGLLRVAAYCRVSSDSADQLHSYAAQIDFYTKLIGGTEGWQFIDIYADEGITGTRTDKREEFHRLMRDCRKGKIDKILVKSVARFARNTRDCLTALRELKSLGVSVRFERENIDTETLTSELMVSVSGSLAQEESISISGNQRWSYQRRMKNGEFITCKAPFGYELMDGKHLKVIESEAEIVRWMFDSYLSGMSMNDIAEEITKLGIPTTDGSHTWQYKTVKGILSNERYMGDALLQKKCTTDEFPFKKVPNKGQKAQYYVENSHPAIVSRNTFERAQELRKRQTACDFSGYAEYPLSKKLICGNCGETFKRRQTEKGYVCWTCRRHDRDKQLCGVGRVAESETYSAFQRMLVKLKKHSAILLRPALTQLLDLRDAMGRGNPEMLALNTQIAQMTEQVHVLNRLRTKGILDTDTYFAKCNAVNANINELRGKRRAILQSEDDDTIDQLKELIRIIEQSPDEQGGFDTVIFEQIVEKIIVDSQERIRFRLLGEVELTERIQGKGR